LPRRKFEFSHDQEFLGIISGEGVRQNLFIKTGNIIGTARGRIDGPNFLHRMIAESEGFLELEHLSPSADTGDADWLLRFFWKVRLKSTFALGLPKLYVSRADILPTVTRQPSTPSHSHCRVEPVQLNAGLLCGKPPIRFDVVLVAAGLPSGDFVDQGLLVRDARVACWASWLGRDWQACFADKLL
jgi:hypothetical protein